MSAHHSRISVIVLTRDRAPYLSMTLSSLLAQTIVGNLDVHIVDGSAPHLLARDHHDAQVPECMSRLFGAFTIYGARFFYHPVEPNLGIPRCYQMVHDQSTTEFIYRTEDDVFLEPECLERLLDCLLGDATLAAVAPMTPNFDCPRGFHHIGDRMESGFWLQVPPDYPEFGPLGLVPFDVQSKFSAGDRVYEVCHIHGGCLYRRSAVEAIGGWAVDYTPTGHREETIIYVRLYFAGQRMAVRTGARLVHFEASKGGSRPKGREHESRLKDRRADEEKFQRELRRLIMADSARDVVIFEGSRPIPTDEYRRRVAESESPSGTRI